MGCNTKVYLFVEKNNHECAEAMKFLKEKGIEFNIIDVDENGVRGWMLYEFGTSKTPVATTPDAVLIGLRAIKEYFSNFGTRI